MANNVKISIDLESEEAQAELKRLASSFSKVEDAVEGADAATDNLAKSGKKMKGFAGDADKASASTKQMSSAMNSFGAKFLTMELGKKALAFADATLTAAAANEGLSAQTRATAQSYLEVKENVGEIASGMVLAVANIGAGLGRYAGLSKLIEETADYWQSKVNGEKSAEAVRQEKALADATEKYNKALDKKKQKVAETSKATTQAINQEMEQLRALALQVKSTYGGDAEQIERTYNAEIAKLDKLKAKKLITLKEYEDARAKAVQARNSSWASAGLDEIDMSGAEPTEGGDAAAVAYDKAYKEAEARNQARADSDAESLNDALLATKRHNEQIKAWDAELTEARMASLNTFLGGYVSLFSTLAAQNRKYALAAKTVSVFQAIINTREAATKAWAQGGIFGALGAAGALAGGFAQVASIKAQKFAAGGIVAGTSYTEDKVPVALNSDEMILNKTQQARLFSQANGQTVAQSAPSLNLSFNIGGGIHASDVKKMLTENKQEFVRFISQALNSKSFNSSQVLV